MATETWLTVPAPLGRLRLCARGQRLAGIAIIVGAAAAPQDSSPGDPVLQRAAAQLDEYFAGRRTTFELPLDLSGLSPFTRRVLDELQRVRCGETLTYGELAARVGSVRGARAIGRAMAANPLPIVIPCHRVVAAGGRPGGYSGGAGLPTKQWLLAFERSRCR